MNRYHKKFIESYASENIIGIFSRYKKSAKEITESFGMLYAAKKYVETLDDSLVVIVGDGCSPRTGIVFAYFTKAYVVSVDPNFNMEHWDEHYKKQCSMGFPPERIRLIKDKIENVSLDCQGKTCAVIWPHSHASMDCKNFIYNYKNRIDIAMPCCFKIPNKWMTKPHITYLDLDVESPKNTIHIWN